MHGLINLVTLPFIGEVNLSSRLLILFFLCLLCVVGFEFVNGFHDKANVVATVIYNRRHHSFCRQQRYGYPLFGETASRRRLPDLQQ